VSDQIEAWLVHFKLELIYLNLNVSGIYKIINLKNNKIYIGSSICIIKRWYHHKYHLINNNHSNCYLQNAWNKYGQ